MWKRYKNINSRSSQIKSIAQLKKKTFLKLNNDLTDKENVFDGTKLKQSDNIVEEAIIDCVLYYH